MRILQVIAELRPAGAEKVLLRPGRKWQFIPERLTLEKCDRLTAVSHTVQSFYARNTGIAMDDITVIYNGVPTPRKLSPGVRNKLHSEWNMGGCTKIAGSAGRRDPNTRRRR